jgi:hypothetical protein
MFNKKTKKALVYYADQDIAERVANKKNIEYKNFIFNLKLIEIIESVKQDDKPKIESQKSEINNECNFKGTPLPRDIIKHVSPNSILSIVINERNKKWRSELEKILYPNYASFNCVNDILTIKCKLRSTFKNYEELVMDWENKTDMLIENFQNKFTIDSIDSDRLGLLKAAIKQYNQENGFNVDYEVFKKKINYVAKKNHFQKFKRFFENFQLKTPREEFFSVSNLPEPENYNIIPQLLQHIRINQADLELIQYDSNNQKILIKGPLQNVNEVISMLSLLMKNICFEKLTSISEDAINCNDIIEILERIVKEKKLFCHVSKRPYGFYLTYFRTASPIILQENAIPINKCLNALSELENHILAYYTSLRKDLGVTPSEMLNFQRWSEFKTKYLLGNQEIKIRLLNVDREIIIFGKKEFVFELDSKIDEFLAQIKQSNLKLTNFDQSEVSIILIKKFRDNFY